MTQTTTAADVRRGKELLRRSIQSAEDLVAHEASVRRSVIDRAALLGKIAAANPGASRHHRDGAQPNVQVLPAVQSDSAGSSVETF